MRSRLTSFLVCTVFMLAGVLAASATWGGGVLPLNSVVYAAEDPVFKTNGTKNGVEYKTMYVDLDFEQTLNGEEYPMTTGAISGTFTSPNRATTPESEFTITDMGGYEYRTTTTRSRTSGHLWKDRKGANGLISLSLDSSVNTLAPGSIGGEVGGYDLVYIDMLMAVIGDSGQDVSNTPFFDSAGKEIFKIVWQTTNGGAQRTPFISANGVNYGVGGTTDPKLTQSTYTYDPTTQTNITASAATDWKSFRAVLDFKLKQASFYHGNQDFENMVSMIREPGEVEPEEYVFINSVPLPAAVTDFYRMHRENSNKHGQCLDNISIYTAERPAMPKAESVTLTGKPNINETLTAQYAYTELSTDVPEGASIGWWESAESADFSDAEMIGSTKSVKSGTPETYEIQQADSGKYIRFCVTPKTDNSTGTITEGPTAKSDGTAQIDVFKATVSLDGPVEAGVLNPDASNPTEYKGAVTYTNTGAAKDAILLTAWYRTNANSDVPVLEQVFVDRVVVAAGATDLSGIVSDSVTAATGRSITTSDLEDIKVQVMLFDNATSAPLASSVTVDGE